MNARYLQQRQTGVELYAREIVDRLHSRPRLIAPPVPYSGLRGQIWEQLALPGLVEPDELLWSPANTGPLRVSRQVVTLHDLAPFDHPEQYSRLVGAWLRFLLPRLLQTARGVIVPSQMQRRQVLDRFHLPSERVFSVPCGVDLRLFHPALIEAVTAVRRAFGLPSDYILFCGDLESGSTLRRLLRAWRQIHNEYPGLCLAVIGMQPPASPASQQFTHPGVRFLTRVKEHDLPALYSGALVTIFPSPGSNSESGLKMLEALACGVPVISVNGGVMAEMAGDASLIVDGESSGEWAGEILRVAADARLQADLCCRGLERARQFSWETAAQQMDMILQSLR